MNDIISDDFKNYTQIDTWDMEIRAERNWDPNYVNVLCLTDSPAMKIKIFNDVKNFNDTYFKANNKDKQVMRTEIYIPNIKFYWYD